MGTSNFKMADTLSCCRYEEKIENWEIQIANSSSGQPPSLLPGTANLSVPCEGWCS